MKSFFHIASLLILLTACSAESPAEELQPLSSPSPKVDQPTLAPTAITEDIVAAPSITNIALGKPARTSSTRSDSPTTLALDGITSGGSNFWSAGAEAPQWFEIDLQDVYDIYEINLIVFQYPEGESFHRILGRANANEDFEELHIFEAYTRDGDSLSISPDAPWEAIRYLRIETDSLPKDAYVEWREIQIFGLPAGIQLSQSTPAPDEASLIFYNGEIISMEDGLPIYEAIAIQGELILELGLNEDILALAGEGTRIIDLDGLTIMPGIVDAHTHVLSDSSPDMAANQQLALENGFTTVGEMSTEEWLLDEFESFAQSGNLRIRTNAYLSYVTNCGELNGDWLFEHPPSHEFGERLRIAGAKIFADGGTCSTLPAISWEYPTVGGYGDLFFDQAQLNELVAQINSAGYQIAIHAQGDVAIELSQNALALVLHDGENPLRHRIDHNAFNRPDLIGRYSDLGIYPVIFGAYATCVNNERDAYAAFFGEEYMPWLENWRAFLDANPDLPIAWHGDDPWVVPLSPFLELFGLVTRAEVAEDGSVCVPSESVASGAITVEEALLMMTINSAFVLHREDEVGSLEAGKLADLLIISANPLMIDPYEIKDIVPLMTMIGGVSEYCAAGANSYCP